MSQKPSRRLGLYTVALCVLCVLCGKNSKLARSQAASDDPADWGGDHVGQPLPEYVTGDECLFCHRSVVGPTWSKNPHQRTIREPDGDAPALRALGSIDKVKAAEVKLVLGGKDRLRFLRPAREYGKVDLLSTQWAPQQQGRGGRLVDEARPQWDAHRFAKACAGCHATAVDPKTRSFSNASLDCYVCHGVVDVKHSKDPALILLSRKRHDPARVITSLCAQCHLRDGKSRSSGLPYPENFVAGDNLFRDFQVDFSPEHIRQLNPGDRHIVENVRDVVRGNEQTTCISCHDVHQVSSKKHHRVANGPICLDCHNPTGPRKNRPAYEVHSATCGY